MESGERIALVTILLLLGTLAVLLATGCAPAVATVQAAGRTVIGMWSVIGLLLTGTLTVGAALLALTLLLR